MQKRNTLLVLEGFEKEGGAPNQTKDTFGKTQLVQLFLTNFLIHLLKK